MIATVSSFSRFRKLIPPDVFQPLLIRCFCRGTFAQGANTGIVLVGGVRPSQVFWQVAGTMSIGSGATGASFQGIALGATQITVITGSTVTGRLLGQAGIAIQDSNIMQPMDNGCDTAGTVTVTACKSTITCSMIKARMLIGSCLSPK